MKTAVKLLVLLTVPLFTACSEQVTGGIISSPNKVLLSSESENGTGTDTGEETPFSDIDTDIPTPSPSPAGSPMPSTAPSPEPSTAPSPVPSVAPSPAPSAVPSPIPSVTPNPGPGVSPTPSTPPKPEDKPTPKPSHSPKPDDGDDDEGDDEGDNTCEADVIKDCAQQFGVPTSRVRVHKQKGIMSLKATDVVMVFAHGNAKDVTYNLTSESGSIRGLCIRAVGRAEVTFNIDGARVVKLIYRGAGSSYGHIVTSNGGVIAEKQVSLSGEAQLDD